MLKRVQHDTNKGLNLKEKKGKFIVIDGSDGAGKKTQADALIAKLENDGYEVAFYDFPQYDSSFFGHMVGQFLIGKFGPPAEANPYLASLIYAGDRWQASNAIKKDLRAGKIVISNRFTSSSMAHQAGKIEDIVEKNNYLKWLEELEFGVYGIPKPNLVIYLYVPLEVSQQLLDKKNARNYVGGKAKDHVESSEVYLANSINEYLRLSKNYPNWQMIDCVSGGKIETIEEISSKVFEVVKKELEKK